jgi:uncharacterized protein YegJ (DUF2314 family)
MPKHTLRRYAGSLGAVVLAALIVSTALAQSLVDKAERDQTVSVPDSDPLMARAMSKARETLPGFLNIASHPTPGSEGFSVKIAVHEGDAVEYFWITPFARSGERFSGRLNNQPETVRSVALGQMITFSQNEIVDWMYMDGKRMMGNYTARAMLQNASPAERAEFKKRFGLDADF